jgi:hypothetical protein
VAVPAGVADLNRQASAPGAHEVDISGDAERPSSADRGRAIPGKPNIASLGPGPLRRTAHLGRHTRN